MPKTAGISRPFFLRPAGLACLQMRLSFCLAVEAAADLEGAEDESLAGYVLRMGGGRRRETHYPPSEFIFLRCTSLKT
jgi:hypothetical protein